MSSPAADSALLVFLLRAADPFPSCGAFTFRHTGSAEPESFSFFGVLVTVFFERTERLFAT